MKTWEEVLDRECFLLEDALKPMGDKTCTLVDVGCGSLGLLGRKGDRLSPLKRRSLGIDIDQEALGSNISVKHRVCASCYALPLKSSSVDLIVCRWVFEHLETPEQAMRECGRILRTGGLLYIKTPNLWNYAMMLSHRTPTRFHNFVRARSGQCDNIPTFYRANTRRKLTELATANGFVVRRWEHLSYSYMYYAFNKELFVMMRGLSKMIGKVTDRMQQSILCILEKVEGHSG